MNALTDIKAASAPCDDVKWHPYSELFPWIEGAAFEDLKADIAANGIREPIVFFEGQVLDGRNRYMAARDLGIEYPRVEYTGDDPLGFVVSLNLRRRHLTESQRGMVAKRLETHSHGGDRKSVQNANLHLDRESAAEKLNVSSRTVANAARVIDHGTADLVAAVDAGTVSVSAAAEVAKLPVEEQQSIVDAGSNAIKEVAKVVRETGAGDDPEIIALRESVTEAARQGLKPEKRKSRKNPNYKPTPGFQMLMNIVGPTNALAEQVERGEIDVALALNGFTDDAMRESCLRGVTQCRDFLSTFLETANAH